MTTARLPGATYRFQFNRDFSLDDARSLVPYLQALGITDIYASPLLQARRGSDHGYDVTDPTRVNRELGGEAAFTRLAETLAGHDMGLVLDIVPNHMAAGPENPWWTDVLRHGRGSPYAPYFDINWQPARPGMAGKVLLPVLGSPYGETLEKGELALVLNEDGLWVRYHDHRFPLAPGSHQRVLAPAGRHKQRHPGAAPRQLADLAVELEKLPPPNEAGFDAAFRAITDRLWSLYRSGDAARTWLDDRLRAINGTSGDPAGFNQLDEMLAAQHYRLAYWRTAHREINYRRFFSISELVAVRVEDEQVFTHTHALVLRLARAGRVTGLRIDHVDGLHDPEAYLRRLRDCLDGSGKPGFYVVVEKILGKAARGHTSELEVGGWKLDVGLRRKSAKPISNNNSYLQFQTSNIQYGMSPMGEELPADWPVYGTSGYDFMNLVNGLFVHEAGLKQLEQVYRRHGGIEESFAGVTYRLKKRVMAEQFGGEMRTLAGMLGVLAERDRHGRDLTLDELEEALVEVNACFPVYRTYTNNLTVTPRDRAYIEQATADATRHNPGITRAVGFLRRVLLLEGADNLPGEQQEDWLRFVMRWQQYTGPVTAKGVEDAAMYLYNPLVSLNEVGGEPGEAAVSIAEFHLHNLARAERLPHAMNATSTHDTKRSEDVRMRINVLSETPARWNECLERWRRWNQGHKQQWNGRAVPGGNMEQFIYQTLVGAWPLDEGEVPAFKERLAGYLVKAAREAGTHTGWLQPDEGYEKALVRFTMSILEPGEDNLFLPDFTRFQAYVAYYGALNSLAQLLLKITCPGVPDFYRGTELWDFSLVDPDNRRPVDFATRSAMLAQLRERESGGRAATADLARELLDRWRDGRVKLYLTHKALQFRRSRPELFAGGEYIPVEANGPGAGHVCAFARRLGESWALVAVPRLPALLRAENSGLDAVNSAAGEVPPPSLHPGVEMWGDTYLLLPADAPGVWRNVPTGETLSAKPGPGTNSSPGNKILPLHDVWQSLPVALLAGA